MCGRVTLSEESSNDGLMYWLNSLTMLFQLFLAARMFFFKVYVKFIIANKETLV